MSIVPPSEGGSQDRRRAAGTSRRIRWNKISPEQQQSVRENFTRNQWRRVVNAIIENLEHYANTGDNANQYNYKMHIAEAIGWDEDRWNDFEEDAGDTADSLGWYHPLVGFSAGLA